MKRAAVAALAALLVSAAWPQTPPRLLVWINGDKGYNGLQKVGDAFTAATGVPVQVQHPEGAPEKFQAAAAGGKGPDVFCWPHDRVGEWAQAGLIVPVQAPRAVREAIDDSAWKAFQYKGRVWGYPLAIEAIGLVINTNLVKTPPRTFADVVALDKQLTAQGKKALLWDYNKTFFSWPLLAGAGGHVFGRSAQGELNPQDVGVNTPGAVKAGELLNELITHGVLPKGARYAEMEAGFARGQGLFNQNFGEINAILSAAFGIKPAWFADPWLAKAMLLIVNTWLGYPYFMVLATGVIKAIPSDLYEASAIAGAGPWVNFRRITAPLILKPLTPLLISAFAFNFNNFVLIALLTDGRPDFLNTLVPAGTTDILVTYTYRIAFTDAGQNFGLAAAISTLIFLLVAVISLINLRFTREASKA
ncbi:hypothetical protein B566_EDAN019061 [Ephemera danica]|nr:hypothetical protein B566_EDAN019061 [Ephemera danica]